MNHVLNKYPNIIKIFFFGLQYGETSLHFTAKNGNIESARMLLDHGANVNATTEVRALKGGWIIAEHDFIVLF